MARSQWPLSRGWLIKILQDHPSFRGLACHHSPKFDLKLPRVHMPRASDSIRPIHFQTKFLHLLRSERSLNLQTKISDNISLLIWQNFPKHERILDKRSHSSEKLKTHLLKSLCLKASKTKLKNSLDLVLDSNLRTMIIYLYHHKEQTLYQKPQLVVVLTIFLVQLIRSWSNLKIRPFLTLLRRRSSFLIRWKIKA